MNKGRKVLILTILVAISVGYVFIKLAKLEQQSSKIISAPVVEYRGPEVEVDSDFPVKCNLVKGGDRFIDPLIRGNNGSVPRSINFDYYVGQYNESGELINTWNLSKILNNKINTPIIHPGEYLCTSISEVNLQLTVAQ